MTNKFRCLSEKGYYIVRFIVLLSLANLFLSALISFASTIKLANTATSKNSNYTALGNLETYEVSPFRSSKSLNCNTTHISDNLNLSNCLLENTNKTIVFLDEIYE